MNDEINHPDHYTVGGIETIKVLKAKLTREQYIGYLLGTKMVYDMRANHKGQFIKDIRKAAWYARELEQFLEEQPADGVIRGLGFFSTNDMPTGKSVVRADLLGKVGINSAVLKMEETMK